MAALPIASETGAEVEALLVGAVRPVLGASAITRLTFVVGSIGANIPVGTGVETNFG